MFPRGKKLSICFTSRTLRKESDGGEKENSGNGRLVAGNKDLLLMNPPSRRRGCE
jgi:hypothetical protein